MDARMIDSAAQAESFPFTLSAYRVQQVSFDLLIEIASPGVDKPYPVYGGLFREEAIMLLRRFYVQENEKGNDAYRTR